MRRKTTGQQRGEEKRQMALDLHAMFQGDIQLIEQLLKEYKYDNTKVISILSALNSCEKPCAPVDDEASIALSSDSYYIYSQMFKGILSDESLDSIWVETLYSSADAGEDEAAFLTRATSLAVDYIASDPFIEEPGARPADAAIKGLSTIWETYVDDSETADRRAPDLSLSYARALQFSNAFSLPQRCPPETAAAVAPQGHYEEHAAAQHWASVQAQEYESMVQCFRDAARSHSQGSRESRGLAVVHAEKGRDHERRMAHARTMHCKTLFESKNSYACLKVNADRRIEIDHIGRAEGRLEVDFHGLFVKEALEVLTSLVSLPREVLRVDELMLICGKGNHSAKHVCKIKVAFENFLSRGEYSYTANGGAGHILVRMCKKRV